MTVLKRPDGVATSRIAASSICYCIDHELVSGGLRACFAARAAFLPTACACTAGAAAADSITTLNHNNRRQCNDPAAVRALLRRLWPAQPGAHLPLLRGHRKAA